MAGQNDEAAFRTEPPAVPADPRAPAPTPPRTPTPPLPPAQPDSPASPLSVDDRHPANPLPVDGQQAANPLPVDDRLPADPPPVDDRHPVNSTPVDDRPPLHPLPTNPAPVDRQQPTGRRGWRRGDLESRPFPEIPPDAATDPAAQRAALARLREWAESSAEDTIDWYLRDKRLKSRGSRLLQGLAIAFAVAGTAVPLATAASGGSGQGWGYVLLAVAAGCKGYDYFFGLSATWMRDIAVAQALRTELNAVRLEWAADLLRTAPGVPGPPGTSTPGTNTPAAPTRLLEPAKVERQLALVNRLADAVRGHIDAETADWQADFSSRTQQLQGQGQLTGTER